MTAKWSSYTFSIDPQSGKQHRQRIPHFDAVVHLGREASLQVLEECGIKLEITPDRLALFPVFEDAEVCWKELWPQEIR